MIDMPLNNEPTTTTSRLVEQKIWASWVHPQTSQVPVDCVHHTLTPRRILHALTALRLHCNTCMPSTSRPCEVTDKSGSPGLTALCPGQ